MDNFDKILPILNSVWNYRFEPVSFHVTILQRRKDGIEIANNAAQRTVAEWFVYSEDRLRHLKPAIESLCQIYQARCYITVNGKTDESVLWKLVDDSLERIKNNQKKSNRIFSHSHDTAPLSGKAYWIIDIDNPDVDLIDMCASINRCKSGFYPETVVAVIPTKNGHHIITRPFDHTALIFPPNVEIKKNNATLLYWV